MRERHIHPRLRIVNRLDWSVDLELRVVDVGDAPGASFFEQPGPQRVPTRGHLELFAGPGGTVALLQQPDGEVGAVAIWIDSEASVTPLPEAPLALSAAPEDLWVLTRDELRLLDLDGGVRQRHQLEGMTLVGADGGAVWVVGFESAWYFDGDGRLRLEAAWPGGVESAVDGATLCCLDRGEPRRLLCLQPDGELSHRTPASTPGPFERLLGVAGESLITHAGPSLRWADASGATEVLTVQGAGLAASGQAFVSERDADTISLWIEGNPVVELTLSSKAPVAGAVTAIAVTESDVLVYGLDFGAHYQDGRVVQTFAVDEEVYRRRIFPHAWKLGGPRYATADSQGRVLLSATGPSGVAVIAVERAPREGGV